MPLYHESMKRYELRSMGTSEKKWTAVGLGTWMTEKNPVNSVRALQAGLDEGANHIDTAEMYGEGQAEEIVGEAIQGRREKINLVSKVLPSHASYDETISACHKSLKRLKTDHLDVYLLHWRESQTPLTETFRAFEKLKEQGKIRAWGVSNFDVEDLEEALTLVGPGKIVCNQVLYHLQERAIESRVIPWCVSHGVSVVAYSPFGQNRMPRHEALEDIAKKHDASPYQIVLAYLTRNPAVLAIPKSSDLDRARSNVQAMGITLTPDEIKKIDSIFPLKPRKSLPMI